MTYQKEPKLTYALDSSEKMVHIGSVERGLSCNCRCPKCNEFLVAKLGHEGGRQAHFAHRKGSDCHDSYMSALHKLAEQIIEEEKAVMAPPYKEIDKQKLEFEKVEVEQRVERKDLQPDLVGVTANGLRWFIEIKNTHGVDAAKRAKLMESEITCLEIDVGEQTLEGLKSFLLESTENREWINNPIYDKRIEDSYRKKVSEIVKRIESKPELDIPKSDNVFLENLSTSVSEDGLYACIKATSSNGVSYLLHIGSHEVLKQISPTKESNELLVDVDKNQSINGLCWERLYFYKPKRETETEIEKYRDNPEYVVRPKIDCYSNCKYRPFLGKCIYLETTVLNNEVEYVVCNQGKKDEDSASQRSQVNRHSSNNEYYNASNQHHNIIRENNYSEVPHNIERRIGDERKKANRERLVVPFTKSDNSKTEVRPYFNISVKGFSLREICDKIEVEKSVTIEGYEVNAVEMIDVRSRNDGIVFFCKCNDRVYPYKVIAAWLENERLKYNLIANRKGKDYNNALELYHLALLSTIEVESINQDNIRDKSKQGVF